MILKKIFGKGKKEENGATVSRNEHNCGQHYYHNSLLANSDMNFEAARLRTFKNWTSQYVDKAILAKIGFFYTGKQDYVKCHFCGVGLGLWMKYDDELDEHLRWSPTCPLIRNHRTKNVPIEEVSMLKFLLDSIGVDEVDTPVVAIDAAADNKKRNCGKFDEK